MDRLSLIPFVFSAATLLAIAQVRSEEYKLEFDASEQGTLDFEAAQQSLIHVVMVESPPNFSPRYSIKNSESGPDTSGDFRVTPGAHTLTISHRFTTAPPGKVHVKVYVVNDPDPSEPANNALSTPRIVELGKNFSLQMFPSHENDFLAIELPGPGYLVLKPVAPVEGLNPMATGTDPSGLPMGENLMRTDSAGYALLKIKDQFSRSRIEAIEFTSQFIPESDFDEPNNHFEDALELQIGEWREILLAPYADIDHFLVKVPRPGILEVETIVPDKFMPLNFELLDLKTGSVVSQSNALRVAEAGDYVLRVRSQFNTASLDPFSFRLNWKNDLKITPRSSAEATVIEPGRRYGSKSAGRGDTDRMKVKVDSLSIVTFQAEAVANVEPIFRHEKKEANPLWVRTDKDVEAILKPRWEKYSPNTIWVEANIEPEIDPSEPNDSVETAKAISLGKFQEFYLHPAGDEEWFEFKVEKDGDFIVSISEFDGAKLGFNRGTIKIFSNENVKLHELKTPGHLNFISKGIPLEKGIHRLHFADSWSQFRSATPLYLTVYRSGSSPSLPETHLKKAPNTAGVFVVGVEMGGAEENTRNQVEDAGGIFTSAHVASQIGEKLDGIVASVEHTPEERKRKSNSWWWLLILLAVVVTWYIRKKLKKKPST